MNALGQAGLLELRDHLFTRTSGGERQRTAIAMALASEPKIILMDEPTSHLDLAHRTQLITLLRRLHREHGITTLMIGHDLNLAAEHFPRIVLLNGGRVVADGPPSEVLTPALLEAVYHCPVATYEDPLNGALRVFPK